MTYEYTLSLTESRVSLEQVGHFLTLDSNDDNIYPFSEESSMLLRYIESAMKKAKYKILDNGTWFAEIPGYPGVWANGKTIEECRNELIEVLEEWILLKTRDHEEIPLIEGIDINVKMITV